MASEEEEIVTRRAIDALLEVESDKFDGSRICAPPTCSTTLFAKESIDAVSIDTNTDEVLIVMFCPTFR